MAKPGHGSTRLPEHDARWGDFIPKKRSSHQDTARKMAETTLSLVSGTFVLLARFFFFLFAAVIGAACRAPERRTAKMKISYTFANGENSEVEVNEEIGTFILDSRREEDNLGRKERYHCYSLDAAEFEGEDMADCETPEMAMIGQFDREHIAEALGSLSDVKRRRILMLAQGLSVREIARREGKEIKTIRESIAGAREKFKKFF